VSVKEDGTAIPLDTNTILTAGASRGGIVEGDSLAHRGDGKREKPVLAWARRRGERCEHDDE
jgi:hypothetical protein